MAQRFIADAEDDFDDYPHEEQEQHVAPSDEDGINKENQGADAGKKSKKKEKPKKEKVKKEKKDKKKRSIDVPPPDAEPELQLNEFDANAGDFDEEGIVAQNVEPPTQAPMMTPAELKRFEKEEKQRAKEQKAREKAEQKERERLAKLEAKAREKEEKERKKRSKAKGGTVEEEHQEAAFAAPAATESSDLGMHREPSPLPPVAKASKRTAAPTDGYRLRVWLLDDSEFMVDVPRGALGHEALESVCKYLDLAEKDYFGLSYRDAEGLRYWLNSDKKVWKQLKAYDSGWTDGMVYFEVKFYPPDPSHLHEDFTRYQLCLQVRRDIVSGRLPCSFVTLALLGSYTAQAELGDYDPEEHGPVGSVQYLNQLQLAPPRAQTAELLEKIAELHKQHKGASPEEAELHFLENAKKLAMYGVELHYCRDCENVQITLGVCASGILVYRERLRINRFAWPKVVKISYRKNYFFLRLRPAEFEEYESNVGFRCESSRLAKRLWRTAVEHHTFFRLKEPEAPKRFLGGLLSTSGSRFRFSMRTHHQLRSTTLDRRQKSFQRSASRRTTSMATGLNDSAYLAQSPGGFGQRDSGYGQRDNGFGQLDSSATMPARLMRPSTSDAAPPAGEQRSVPRRSVASTESTPLHAGGEPRRVEASRFNEPPVAADEPRRVEASRFNEPPAATSGEPMRITASRGRGGDVPEARLASTSRGPAQAMPSSVSAPTGFQVENVEYQLSGGPNAYGRAEQPQPAPAVGRRAKPSATSQREPEYDSVPRAELPHAGGDSARKTSTTTYRTERDGKIGEVRVVKAPGRQSGRRAARPDDSRLLAEAIENVTAMKPQLTVERIEIKAAAYQDDDLEAEL